MLTRDQNYTLFASLKNVGVNVPNDVRKLIANIGFDSDPESEVTTLLHFVAFGDLANVKAMLDQNPSLIGRANHVVSPSGLLVRYVKPYECALGAGNVDMAQLIAGYFDHFTDGAEEKAAQDKKYLPYIEALAAQIEANSTAYNVSPLILQIINASDDEVRAALNKSEDLAIPLCKALAEFRDAVRPPVQQTTGLHYQHYTTILHALKLLTEHWSLLNKHYTNFFRCNLVWNQIIGFLSRSMSFRERCALARGFVDNQQTLVCHLDAQQSFPESCDQDTEGSGLGFDYAISGSQKCASKLGGDLMRYGLIELYQNKIASLLELCRQEPCCSEDKRRKIDTTSDKMRSMRCPG